MSVRFCPQCGVKALARARFCADCGAALAADDSPPAAGRWHITAAGTVVLLVFLGAGLTIWTMILAPGGPRPGPGGPTAGRPGAAAQAGADRTAPRAKAELPAEVKTFIADLAAKAKAKPDDVDAWLKLAQVNSRAAQLDPGYQADAQAAFQHVLDLDPKNADALRGLANVHYDREDHQKAIPVYERYLALRPDDASARTDLGTMYLYAGQPKRAISTYEEVIKQNPSFLQAHYNLAVTYHGQGNDSGALTELDIARRLATEDGVRKQIDDMIASLKGDAPRADAPRGEAQAAVPAGDGSRSPFQGAVEEAFRAHPIMGGRIVRFEWTAPGSGRVVVREFPMEGMPQAVRDKFKARLEDQLRTARSAHPVDGAVRVEIADAGSGTVMETLSP
jgi:tetratricopeptide (TPR) repeat protein